MRVKELRLGFRINTPLLALGSQVKNTVCFAAGKTAYISGIHDDLTAPADLADFERDAKSFIKKGVKVIAHDLHPDYLSTKLASALGKGYRVIPVQHHHAHIAACMLENSLPNEPVIGVAFDGTGLGDDGKIWGAEFLVSDYKKMQRMAHLKEVPLVGGERAIVEPWRLVAAWFAFPKKLDKDGLLKKIYQANINSPLASSMGRLFDAAASIILNKQRAAFEAELAIELEKLALKKEFKVKGYQFKIVKQGGISIIDPLPVLKGIVSDIERRETKERIAWRFHFSIARMVLAVCLSLRNETKINKVVLSGGVFQNKVLLGLVSTLLGKEKFLVFRHNNLSCNDSCLSLGQAVVANYRG